MRSGKATPALRCLHVALAALTLACAGCTDYLARRDTLTPGSGDAVQINIARHVIDPWPRHAGFTNTDMSGERLQHAIERYRNPSSGSNLGEAGGGVPAGTAGVSAAPTRTGQI